MEVSTYDGMPGEVTWLGYGGKILGTVLEDVVGPIGVLLDTGVGDN